MSYEFSNADVCIILSPCGLERFNAMVEDLDPGVREEVLDILDSADIEEAEDREGNVMWLLRGTSWDATWVDGESDIHDFLYAQDNRDHVLYMVASIEEEYGVDDIDVGNLDSSFYPTIVKRIDVSGITEV